MPCKQTDFITRIIALFRVLLYRVSSKKLLKIENTRSNQLEPEFSFSFDPELRAKGLQYNKNVYIGENTWIGAGVVIVPGVHIGKNTVL